MQRLPHPHLLPHARRAPPLCSAVKGRSVSQSMDMGFHSQIKSVERRTTSSSTSAHLQFLLCSLEQGLPRSSEPPPMAARGAPSSTAQHTSRTPGTDSPSSPLSPGIFGLKNGGDEHGGGAGCGKETERALRWRLTCGPHYHVSKTASQNQPMAKIELF